MRALILLLAVAAPARAEVLYEWGIDKPWFRFGVDAAAMTGSFEHTSSGAGGVVTSGNLKSQILWKVRYANAAKSWLEWGLEAGKGRLESVGTAGASNAKESVTVRSFSLDFTQFAAFARPFYSWKWAELFVSLGPVVWQTKGETTTASTDAASSLTTTTLVSAGTVFGPRLEFGVDLYPSQFFAIGFSTAYIRTFSDPIVYEAWTPGVRFTYLWGSPTLGALDDGGILPAGQ